MQRIFNILEKSKITAVILSVLTISFYPATIYASNIGDPVQTKNNSSPTSQFCTNISTEASNVTSKLSALVAKVTQAQTQRNQTLTTQWQQIDQKIAANRQQASTELSSDFSMLEAKATTAAEKQAVQTYETTVNSLITTRIAAHNSAIQTFRAAVQSAISSRQSTVTNQLTTFEDTINTAIATAESSCTSDPSSASTIHQTFQASLQAAQLAFKNGRSSDNTIKTEIQGYAATRDASFKTADSAFMTAQSAAAKVLAAAFA